MPTNRFAQYDWLDAVADNADASEHDVIILALIKGNERYVFLYDEASRVNILRTLGQFASDDELSFTWYDAVVLSQKIREGAE